MHASVRERLRREGRALRGDLAAAGDSSRNDEVGGSGLPDTPQTEASLCGPRGGDRRRPRASESPAFPPEQPQAAFRWDLAPPVPRKLPVLRKPRRCFLQEGAPCGLSRTAGCAHCLSTLGDQILRHQTLKPRSPQTPGDQTLRPRPAPQSPDPETPAPADQTLRPWPPRFPETGP
ncbi:unnamed protein product [Rangifer tarandus platyrhynchus]|uniref:Uncharacterized protein n=1 Tax=Rangifer tarandus platyrhynchus TaxID=3082113 RepID=A0ABN8YXD9_RANTA|nr:unnamed protein product [Rangifer tarandus platyrhynchus]